MRTRDRHTTQALRRVGRYNHFILRAAQCFKMKVRYLPNISKGYGFIFIEVTLILPCITLFLANILRLSIRESGRNDLLAKSCPSVASEVLL
jgi:hypothetical protein